MGDPRVRCTDCYEALDLRQVKTLVQCDHCVDREIDARNTSAMRAMASLMYWAGLDSTVRDDFRHDAMVDAQGRRSIHDYREEYTGMKFRCGNLPPGLEWQRW